MPIIAKWYDKANRIFIFEIVAPWSIDDVLQALQDTATFEEDEHPTSIIYDVRHGRTIPRSFLSVVRALQSNKSNRVRVRALVGANYTWHVLYKLIDRAFPTLTERFIFRDTIDEAVDFILARYDPPNITTDE
jgi:hypothetical protein